jgi:hypothetical protein
MIIQMIKTVQSKQKRPRKKRIKNRRKRRMKIEIPLIIHRVLIAHRAPDLERKRPKKSHQTNMLIVRRTKHKINNQYQHQHQPKKWMKV